MSSRVMNENLSYQTRKLAFVTPSAQQSLIEVTVNFYLLNTNEIQVYSLSVLLFMQYGISGIGEPAVSFRKFTI